MEGKNEDEVQELENLEIDADADVDSEANAEAEEFIGDESMEDDEDYLDDEDYQDQGESEDFDFGGSEPEPLGGIYGLFKETLNNFTKQDKNS